jgi:UDP-GlcNAc:undecaprenyl-phosphate/decaprenyl-phosphate GlcNAc-1-phosphate transferase
VTFPFNEYAAAIASAAATTLAALPVWRRWCLRAGLVDDPGHRKIHDQPIPLAGGLAVMTGMLLPVLFASAALWWQGSPEGFRIESATPAPPPNTTVRASGLDQNAEALLLYGLNRRAIKLAAILAGALGILAVGWLDDKRELRPKVKFAGQLLVAALVAASGARITLFVPSMVFSYAITILWIVTVINALNFMDNMNGLCAGLGAIGAWQLAIVAVSDGQYLVAAIAFLTFGALLGFLPYNFPRARAFLGDAGSHLVGYLLAVLAILPHFSTPLHPKHWAVLIPLFVLAIPLLDLTWVVLLRWRIGRPFYVGDTNHLSHRLVRRGFTHTQAVLLIWLAAALCGGLGCWLLG